MVWSFVSFCFYQGEKEKMGSHSKERFIEWKCVPRVADYDHSQKYREISVVMKNR